MKLAELVQNYKDEINYIFAQEYGFHLHVYDRNIIYPGALGYDEEPKIDLKTSEEVIKERFGNELPEEYYERQHKKQFDSAVAKARLLEPKEKIKDIIEKFETRINASNSKLRYTALSRLTYRKLDAYLKLATHLDNEREKQEVKSNISQSTNSKSKNEETEKRRQEFLSQIKQNQRDELER